MFSEDHLDRLAVVLRVAELRLNAFLEHSTEIVALLGPDSRILCASPATKRWLGYVDEDFVGRTAYDFIHPDDAERARTELAKLRTSTKPIVAEARFRHRDRSWRHVRGIFVNRTDDPAVNGVVVNYRDVTPEYQAERRTSSCGITPPSQWTPSVSDCGR